nr:hypothetical protein CFP56_02916 [Quercus suber]
MYGFQPIDLLSYYMASTLLRNVYEDHAPGCRASDNDRCLPSLRSEFAKCKFAWCRYVMGSHTSTAYPEIWSIPWIALLSRVSNLLGHFQ